MLATLAARVDSLEEGRLQDRETVSRLETRLGAAAEPDRLRHGLTQMRAELQQLADHIRAQATVGDSLVEMRSEIDGISQEIRRLKEASEASAARVADDNGSEHTVVEWLKDMVTMLKGQVADLAESFNVTRLLQLQQNSEARSALLEGDVRTLEDSVQTLRAHRRADGSQLTQLRADLAELLAKSQDRHNTYAHLLDEVATLRKELLLSPAPSATAALPRHHRRRHHRRHRGHGSGGPFQLHALEHVVDVIYRQQLRLDGELREARRNVTSQRERQQATERRQEELADRLEQGERARQELSWQLNVTAGRDTMRDIQTSTQQLVREVEELETKLDSRVVEMRHDLARLDVSYDQLNSAVQQVKDEYKEVPSLRNKVKQQLATLTERQELDRTSLLTLQSDMLSYALDCCRPAAGAGAPDAARAGGAEAADTAALGAARLSAI
ncbi:protein scabrous-like [Pollicipes pollicipes]|uniref:protein scabrous-like n=1 Tax=Pollicipes pollicipes TaxID=41117 RepID=UPI001884D0CA|nr:protein scabrous-like [Pollicipes pollicipes]